jgi:uncharacterized protein
VLEVSELYVYPVKGASAVALEAARLDPFGIEHDRRWMVVDEAGAFVTQRDRPWLGQLETALRPDALVLRSRSAGECTLPLRPDGGTMRAVRIWDDVVTATDAGDDAAAFISAHLEHPVRLLFMPDSTLRQADLDYARPGDRVSFADGFPLLLATQASLDELNSRLAEPVPMLRFRPNVVVRGPVPAHDEDAWRAVRIGDVACDVVKPCARCVVTTVDTATAAPGKEPLHTLSGYRRWNGKVWFAQNLVHRAEGVLQLGDAVDILERGEPRPPLQS